ncbi:MAG: PEP-utilizing enzyme [Dehalococcoidia bacterium]
MSWTWNLYVREFMPQRDLKKYPMWFMNFGHSYPAWTPLFGWHWNYALAHGLTYGVNETWIPTIRGSEVRNIEGCALAAAMRISDEAEIKEREKKFRKYILEEYAPNWDKLYKGMEDEINGLSKKFRTYDYEKATQYELYKIFREAVQYLYRSWEGHFYMMFPMYTAYWYCDEIAAEYGGVKEFSPTWHKIIRGYDNELFAQDKALWGLRARALELKIDDIFTKNAASEVIPALKKTKAGKEWVEKDLNDFLVVKGYGWRSPRMMEFIVPSWWEDPTPAIGHIQQYLSMSKDVKAPFLLDTIRPRLVKEREELTRELIDKVKAARYPDMEWFQALLSVSQRTSAYSETHDVAWEQGCLTTFRYLVRQIGQRLVKFGTIGSPDDMFFFIPDELELFIAYPDSYDVKDLAEERKKTWTAQKEYRSRPPIFTSGPLTPDDINKHQISVHDAIVSKVVAGAEAARRPETGAICFGNCGSPSGTAEGRAHLVLANEDVFTVQPGDILVCPSMSSGWTPVLPMAKGIVTNGGGSLSHACIHGREYDIPVVSNTRDATMVIKEGEKIRVDATEGLVFRI